MPIEPATELLIDLGNSRLKWALWSPERLHVAVPIEPVNGTYTELQPLIAAASVTHGARICSTAGAVADALYWQLAKILAQPLQVFISPASGLGVVNGYAQPERLGSDRYLAMAAARACTHGAYLVADAGTALTLDLVDAQGRHQGGQIIPGPALMRDSLHRGTAAVRSETQAQVQCFARSTTDAVWSGAIFTCAAAIDVSLRLAAKQLDAPVSLLLCGGAAPLLLPHLESPARHCPDLVLQGLAIWAAVQH